MDLDDHHHLLNSLSEAHYLYEAFPDAHLNSFQVEILEEVIEYLDLKCEWNMAATHLVFTDLALDKFSGTAPDQDAEYFIQLIERKTNFALGDATANLNARANTSFRKKALFSYLLRGPAAEWYGSTIEVATQWEDIRTHFIIWFSDRRIKFRHRLEVEHCVQKDEEK